MLSGVSTEMFNRAVGQWERKQAQRANKSAYAAKSSAGDEGESVGDALQLTPQESEGLLKLAVHITMNVARPGTGDAILIFVSGLADIEKLVELFQELYPGKVGAPTAKVAAVDEVVEEEEAFMEAETENMESLKQLAGLEEEEEEEEGEEEEGEKDGVRGRDTVSRKGPPKPTPVAAKPPTAAAVYNGTSLVRLLPMHSLIAFDSQLDAFDSQATDSRTRVVIATNIAESSITIPGVSTVIDTGRAKTVEYVPRLGTSLLRATWTSQASAIQRQGRAGLVALFLKQAKNFYCACLLHSQLPQHDNFVYPPTHHTHNFPIFEFRRVAPGVCYRLYTKPFFERVMPRYDAPEMLRLTLDSVVLKVKMLGISTDSQVAEAAAVSPERLRSVLSAAAAEAQSMTATLEVGEENSNIGAGSSGAGTRVNSAKALLAQSIQAPDASNVDSALRKLASLGVLETASDTAEVTPFGRALATFPGDLVSFFFSPCFRRTPQGIDWRVPPNIFSPSRYFTHAPVHDHVTHTLP